MYKNWTLYNFINLSLFFSFIFFSFSQTVLVLFYRKFYFTNLIINDQGKRKQSVERVQLKQLIIDITRRSKIVLYRIKPDSISLRIKIRRGFSPQSRAIHSFVYRRAFRGCLPMFLDSNLTRSVEQSRRSFLFVPLAESGRETGLNLETFPRCHRDFIKNYSFLRFSIRSSNWNIPLPGK